MSATTNGHIDRSTLPQANGRAARGPGGINTSSPGRSNGMLSDPFPQGTGGGETEAVALHPVPTRSHPFPLEEGTGERVVSANVAHENRPVPDLGNGRGQGTGHISGHTPGYPVGSAPLPPPAKTHRSSPASSAQTAGPRPAGTATSAPPVNSWSPLNVSDIVLGLQQGTLDQPRPVVGRLAGGSYWLYEGTVNGLAGESGCGKTWTALTTVASELEVGNNVVYIDMEDSPLGIVSRLRNLGVPDDVIADPLRLAYVQPEEAFKDDVRSHLWEVLSSIQPSLVVLDSTGESMALEGVDPNSDDGVARWFRSVATAIANRGPAVLLLDHLPKSDAAAASPIGSQRKRAAISGVQMIQTVGKNMSFAKGRAGEARLTCTKDRHGNFVTGGYVMRLLVNPEPARGDSGVRAVLALDAAEEFAPTRHMDDISTFLQAAGSPQTTGAIKAGVKGKSETLLEALAVLAESGHVVATLGNRNSQLYTLVKPYRMGDPYTVPDHISGSGTAGCGHPWHTGNCKPDWCHSQHHGRCNEMAEQGYVLDVDGEVVSEPDDVVAGRDARLKDIITRSAAPQPPEGWPTSEPWLSPGGGEGQ